MSLKRTSMPGFSGGLNFCIYAKQSTVMLLCVFALSACGPVSSFLHKDTDAPSGSAASQSGSAGPAVVAPLTGPPGMGNRPLAPGERPLGMNVEAMFIDRIKDDDRRFERVENAVKDLRREFEAVKPSILRLVAVEDDMQQLVMQLEALLRDEPPVQQAYQVDSSPIPLVQQQDRMASAPVRPSSLPPKAQPPPEPQAVAVQKAVPTRTSSGGKSVVAGAGGVQVQKLRIGEHRDKTRLVFDVTGAASYRYDIDNNEKLMIVELPGTGWSGPMQWTSGKAPLLASYTVSPLDGGGSRVIVQLKHAASVVYESTLAGGGGKPHRIVVDLRSSSVHK